MKRKKSHLMVMALVTSLLLTACNNKANKSDTEVKKTSVKCNSIRRNSFSGHCENNGWYISPRYAEYI